MATCRLCGERFIKKVAGNSWQRRGSCDVPIPNRPSERFHIKIASSKRKHFPICENCWPALWRQIARQILDDDYSFYYPKNHNYDPGYEFKQHFLGQISELVVK